MTSAELIAIIISLVSVICSFTIAVLQIVNSNKNNFTNLEAEFFKELYLEILMYDIPKGRAYIHYNEKRISGVDQLIDAISEIRRRSLYFKSNHPKYYDELIKICQELEDMLVKTDKEFTSEDFYQFMKSIENMIDNLYEHISKEYIDK